MNLKAIVTLMLLSAIGHQAAAQTCGSLEAAVARCQTDAAAEAGRLESLRAQNQSLRAEIEALNRAQNVDIPQCQRDIGRLGAEIPAAQYEFYQATQERESAEAERQVLAETVRRLEADRFARWECVVKDVKYAYGGYGADADRGRALEKAVNDSGEMARKHGYYEKCFKVYR